MLSIFGKQKKKESSSAPIGSIPTEDLTWSKEALEALDQAASQAPGPKLVKNRLKKQLKKAAEAAAKKSGRAEVSAHDLMQGLLSKLPAEMRNQVEQAARKGPQGVELLQKKLARQKKKK